MATEEFSFNPAAQRLRIAQPHLSNQTKQSEEEPAVRLFERTGRGVRMTEAGEALLEEARRIFVQVDRTVSIARHMGYAKVSRLIFGFCAFGFHQGAPTDRACVHGPLSEG